MTKTEKKLRKYLKEFEVMDLVGFGTILKIEKQGNFCGYIDKIVKAFNERPAHTQEKLLKFCKDVYDYNRKEGSLLHKLISKKKQSISGGDEIQSPDKEAVVDGN